MRYWYPPGGFGGGEGYVPESEYTAAKVLERLLTVDGTGSLLDADKVDGREASYFEVAGHTHTHLNEYLIGCQVSGLAAENGIILLHPLAVNVYLDIRQAGNYAYCKTRATGTPVFTLSRINAGDGGTANLGTVTFSSSSNSGTMGATQAYLLSAGQILQLRAPASQDSTLADISFTFKITKTEA